MKTQALLDLGLWAALSLTMFVSGVQSPSAAVLLLLFSLVCDVRDTLIYQHQDRRSHSCGWCML